MAIEGMNNLLSWLSDMITLAADKVITIPSDYRSRIVEVKKLLANDVSGVTKSMLDYAVSSAAVDYKVVSDKKELDDLLNYWLDNVNFSFVGKIPVGIRALAKEYFKERWLGGSFLLLRTVWEDFDGFVLPTKMWFVDGEDILVEDENDGKTLNGRKYKLRINDVKRIELPNGKNERIFIQKPFASWGDDEPIPFLISRGIYKNLKILSLLMDRGSNVISKALEYLLLMKKGTERMALDGRAEFIYNLEDLKNIKDDFSKFLTNRKTTNGVMSYITNFDTEIEHLIPEYRRILESAIYDPIMARILGGLGLVEVTQGLASDRRETLLNPKPFIEEVYNGINDFKSLLYDVVRTIVVLNKDKHPKYMANNISIYSSLPRSFIDREYKRHLRAAYDRGVLSKRTYLESVCDLNFEIEIRRRRIEKDEGFEELLYPPIITNTEKDVSPQEDLRLNEPKNENEEMLDDRKQAPEKTDFKLAKELELAPYKTNKDLPEQLKHLPSKAKTIWRKAFNNALEEYKDEVTAFKVAWDAVKEVYEKKNDKWVLKEK